MKTVHFVKYWMPAIVWMALIFLGSTDMLSAEHTSRFLVPFLRWLDPHITWATLSFVQTIIRKAGHVTEYAILAALLWRAVRGATVWTSKQWILFAMTWVLCAIFAATDEFHQSYVPSRTSSFHDVLIDICGALAGLTICVALAARKVVKQRRA
ncbi:MAG TPA: VanZ family protein [Chthoniobacterales bacterium]|nr:VanZ family protein [Chthoniobacterales bacterium]